MTDFARILLIEDEAPQRNLVSELLRSAGYQVVAAASGEDGLTELATGVFDLGLCDWKHPGIDGMQVFASMQEKGFDAAFVMVSAYGTIARAVEAVRAGADDYLAKPFERETLLLAVERGLRARRLVDENRRLNEQLSERDRLVDMVGRAPGMQQVYSALQRVADTDVTVLLTGESGTGKELAARALHALSGRREKPFVAVNCAAIPADLADATFFGARKGAFTGSDRDRPGYFQAAAGGTLFLDEVGELPLDLQAEAAVGQFRQDLYYRLAVVPVHMPPLRERREDLPQLVEHITEALVRRHGCARPSYPAVVTRWLLGHTWPGNVRELSNTLERLVLLARDGKVSAEDLPQEAAAVHASGASSGEFQLGPNGLDWESHEANVLHQAMEMANGNRTRAAKLLNMPYKAFLYRLEKYDRKDAGC